MGTVNEPSAFPTSASDGSWAASLSQGSERLVHDVTLKLLCLPRGAACLPEEYTPQVVTCVWDET